MTREEERIKNMYAKRKADRAVAQKANGGRPVEIEVDGTNPVARGVQRGLRGSVGVIERFADSVHRIGDKNYARPLTDKERGMAYRAKKDAEAKKNRQRILKSDD